MYFCIVCRQLHEKSVPGRVFKTGFQSFSPNETYPLGHCQKAEMKSGQLRETARSA